MAAVGGLPFLSIRARLVLSFILIAMVAIGIVGGFSGALLKHFVERRETAYLQSNASTVARQALSLMVPLLRPLSLLELAQTSAFMSDSRIRIMDRAHRVLADSGRRTGPITSGCGWWRRFLPATRWCGRCSGFGCRPTPPGAPASYARCRCCRDRRHPDHGGAAAQRAVGQPDRIPGV